MRNLKVKSLDSIGQYGAIELRRVFPLSCSNDTLFDVFAEVCAAHGFLLTERVEDKASAFKEFHNMFQCVVPGFPWPGHFASSRDIVINISIVSHEKHDYKLLTVIGPRRSTTQQFFQAMETGLSVMSHYWVSQFTNSVKRDFRVSFDQSGSSMSVPETGNQTYKTEEAAYYYFYKILSNQSYSVGLELNAFIQNLNKNEVPPNILMSKVMTQITETVHQFDTNYLSMRNPTTSFENLLPRLRLSVERFVFESPVDEILNRQYTDFFAEMDDCFRIKGDAIRLASTGALTTGETEHGSSSSTRRLQTACGVPESFHFDYTKSIDLVDELQRNFDNRSRPNILLQKMLSIQVSMKTNVLTGSRGNIELESMDEIAPIFLYLVLSSSLKTPNAIYHYLLDYMTPDQRMESEGRIVALLEGATRLVMNEWHKPDLLDLIP